MGTVSVGSVSRWGRRIGGRNGIGRIGGVLDLRAEGDGLFVDRRKSPYLRLPEYRPLLHNTHFA